MNFTTPARTLARSAKKVSSSLPWLTVAGSDIEFARTVGSTKLLMNLASWKVATCLQRRRHFHAQAPVYGERGLSLDRDSLDRHDITNDYRTTHLLLRASEDPEVGLVNFSKGVRASAGARMPRLPALCKPKKKWRLAEQADPTDYLDGAQNGDACWRSNYSSVGELADKVTDVLDDQASWGQTRGISVNRSTRIRDQKRAPPRQTSSGA